MQPGQGITVTADHGKLTHVSVRAAGDPVSGTMNAAGTTWHSKWTLAVSTSYTVSATAAEPGGQPVTTTSSFSTLKPASTAQTMIFEGYHQSYGVGMPIMLTFSQPDHQQGGGRAVAADHHVQAGRRAPGPGTATQTLNFRPREYWPAHTQVTFTGHLDGVEGAPGVYGNHTLTQSFSIGRSLIVVASTATHHMSLYRNGKLYRRWPISTGRRATTPRTAPT